MVKYVLFEYAPGYALFELAGGDDVNQRNAKVQRHLLDFKRFCKVVHLKAFCPFSSAEDALRNIIDLSEGILNPTLRNFLELNVPQEQGATLGVADDKIAVSIRDTLGIKVERSQHVHELVRGIRLHFNTFLKQLSGDSLQLENIRIAQRGLAHAYSRSKVKFNINKADNMIIQSICLLDQLDKDVNTFSMRLRECYSRHFPELSRLAPDHMAYARCVHLLGARSSAGPELQPALADVLGDASVATQVLGTAKLSMGVDLSELDLRGVEQFAKRVVRLAEHRSLIQKYLYCRMNEVAPNLSALIGEVVGARLINHAGSLTNLSKYPASTVQILGAEKALFRALKSRGNTPKYGHIFNSTFISKAKLKDKGRISRYLANKCSIASRLDAFGDFSTPVFGSSMKQQVEDRLHFYETGEAPKKNIDVMKDALGQLNAPATADAAPSLGQKRLPSSAAHPDSPAPKKSKKHASRTDSTPSKSSSRRKELSPPEDTPPTTHKDKKKKKKTPKNSDE